MKVSELSGAYLDVWVAKAEGFEVRFSQDKTLAIITRNKYSEGFSPSTRWGEGGPIIERERLAVEVATEALWMAEKWMGAEGTREDKFISTVGATPLEAAMRCFVASRFGAEVDEASLGN